MTSGSLSYGTVQISVRDASRLKSGDQYTYKIISGQGTNEGGDVDATKINGIIYLLDSQYTIGENDPPYTVNSGIMFLDSNGNTAAITEILTVSNYGHGNDGKDDDIILPPDDPGDKDGDDDTSSFEYEDEKSFQDFCMWCLKKYGTSEPVDMDEEPHFSKFHDATQFGVLACDVHEYTFVNKREE